MLNNWWGLGIGIDYDTENWAESLTTCQADDARAEDEGPNVAKSVLRT
ncbi:MAG: hypothetical protein AAFQ58_07475 [Pseudomonadota bacterium]